MTAALKTNRRLILPILPKRPVNTNMPVTHIDVSAMPNTNMYALMLVVILRKYTATTNTFPGVPKMHNHMITRSYVESGNVNTILDDRLVTFFPAIGNVSPERDPLYSPDMLPDAMAVILKLTTVYMLLRRKSIISVRVSQLCTYRCCITQWSDFLLFIMLLLTTMT